MKGVVKSWNQDKKIGRISPEGGGQELFFHQSDILADNDKTKVGIGSKVEFEPVQPQPAQGPRAKEIKVQSSGQKQQPKVVTADWHAGKPTLTDDRSYLMIPLWVTLKQGDNAAPGIKTTLTTDGVQQTLPASEPTSGPDGKVFFRVFLQPSAKYCDMLLTTPNQHHTYYWENKEQVTKPDCIKIKEGKCHIGDTLTFVTGCGDKTCEGSVVISVKGEIENMVNIRDRTQTFDKSPAIFSTNEKGVVTIGFKRKQFRIRITGALANDDAISASCDLMTA